MASSSIIFNVLLGSPFKKRTNSKNRKPCRHQFQLQRLSTTGEPKQVQGNERPLSSVPHERTIEYLEPCARCKKEKRDSRVYRWKLIGGLLVPYFLASVDLTIVAAALPFLASHFNRLDQLNWIVISFSLTSAAFIPAFGQLADVFGRHIVLQASVFIMMVGSVLCAAAQTWPMLLLGRGLQGASCAGINNLTQIILSDKVSLKESAKNKTLFSLISGLSYSVGPVLGGHLTNVNWRYCFVISIPPCVLAHFAIFFLLRKDLVEGTHFAKGSRRSYFLPGLATVDVGGTLLFVFGTGLIILGTSWGGATYPWRSVQVLASLVIGSVLFVLFFVYEYFLAPGRILARAFPEQTPMLPSGLFDKQDTTILGVVEFATGAAMCSVFYFIGIYFTLVENYPAGKSGTQLLFYLPGIGAGVYTAMLACNVWPAQTWYPLSLGTTVEAIGIALLAWAVTTRDLALVNGIMVLAGAGSGLRFMPAVLHMAGIFPDKLAPAMSFMGFAFPFGGTLALTIMGSVFNNKMTDVFNPLGGSSDGFSMGTGSQSLGAINDLPTDIQEFVRNVGKDAVKWAFLSITPIMAIGLIAVLFLGNVWIKSQKAKGFRERAERDGIHEQGITSSEIICSSYVWAVCTGTVEAKKYISTPLSKLDKERQAQAIFEEKSRLRAARKNKHTKLPSDVESGPVEV